MQTVDSVDKLNEAVWCNHVTAKGMWFAEGKTAISVTGPACYIVVEETKIKILCPTCFMKALQLPNF